MNALFISGQGSPNASLFICGDCPFEESGIEFIEKVSKFLKISREDIYVTSIIKVKAESPSKKELDSWKHLVMGEIELVDPVVILALGGGAAKTLLNTKESITKLRGKIHKLEVYCNTLKFVANHQVVPTFHPSYLEKQPNNEEIRKQLKNDLTIVRNLL